MVIRLTERQVRYAVLQCTKGVKTTAAVAGELGVTQFRGLCLVTFLDDSSRCVTAVRLFTEATSENAVAVLAEAIDRFGTPATVLSDNGRCFNVGRSKKRLPRGSWSPTAFEAALLER